MTEGAVFATFIVVFREALEASLIVGIILTVLVRLGARQYVSHVLLSVLAALLLSFGAGQWLAGMAASDQKNVQRLIEGVISLIAAGVLTYMFFWMEGQSRKIKCNIETKIGAALSAKNYYALISLPFFAVFREGAETVLFLKAVSIQSGGQVSTVGGVSGCFVAVALVTLIFIGGKRVPLAPLFRVTGLLILFMAAGLLAYGIHELEEAHVIPQILYPLYNINHLLNEKEGLGAFMKALFGYNGNPSLTEVAAYWTYFGVVAFAVFKKKKVC